MIWWSMTHIITWFHRARPTLIPGESPRVSESWRALQAVSESLGDLESSRGSPNAHGPHSEEEEVDEEEGEGEGEEEEEEPISNSFLANFKNSPKSNQDEFRDVLNGILFSMKRSIHWDMIQWENAFASTRKMT